MNDQEFSSEIGSLAKALAAAQSKVTGALRDRKNPHTGSMYADLAGIWAACREPLSANDLAIVQTTEPHGMEGVCVVTMLIHSSGQWIRGRLFVPCVGQTRKDGRVMPVDAQTFGSALTYARRYALAAMVGVTPEDDDAEAAVRATRERSAPAANDNGSTKSTPAKSDVDVNALVSAISSAENTDALAKAILAAGRVKDAGKLTPADLDRCRSAQAQRVRELEAAGAMNA